jgi:hypothetical protein
VIKFGMPRKDLHIVLDGVDIKPGLALGSWAAFKRHGSGAMVMGDLVLTEDEVEPVMMKLQEGGIQESAVHNHLIGESPHSQKGERMEPETGHQKCHARNEARRS